ncbi:MAG: Kynureninase (L-kynurenine hydrolase) [Alectoria sarmentosa]|nr:MAG: Kynureninase (L-kynurenine hydrolase) [Alectoria sarmentosa]CAD6579625.1 MAG: Kynureninase (L-kynurenine hydrolase) [Alectoria sarmentosa]
MSAPQSAKVREREHAIQLDVNDPLKGFRKEFLIPTKAQLESLSNSDDGSEPCIYFCGNSLGLQPRRTAQRIASHLSAWATKGVLGHFTEHEVSNLPPFLHVDDAAAKLMAPLVGAETNEVAIMETLTANLHLLMSSFYTPTKEKYKIIIEGKAFPSDHFAVESQIRHRGFDPEQAMVLIEPDRLELATISTSHVLSVIDKHASTTALILLPGIQYYTGQYLDIKTITAHAHRHGILIGWDLAHAVGNVDLRLREWDVDFAAWCNYKYVNSGPGAIDFVPIRGAAGWQVGNPSALALTAVIASLEIFALTDMATIRAKSVAMTACLEDLLLHPLSANRSYKKSLPYQIITPSDPEERGAQLSVRVEPGLLEGVMRLLEDAGIVVDERRPDVIRVAPAPLYNTFQEVWDFANIFTWACLEAQAGTVHGSQEAAALKGQDQKGWAEIK